MTNLFGLIGFPLTHSFSKKYFTEKFIRENIETGGEPHHAYELFELPDIQAITELIKNQPTLKGLNVTIPHKQAVMPFLDSFDDSAKKVGAVNVIKITADKKLIGYNSDYYGFKNSLEKWLNRTPTLSIGEGWGAVKPTALILGNGGAAKAVIAALNDLEIPFKIVSRKKEENTFTYEELSEEIILANQLIINTSPVGTFPKIDECPKIPYEFLTENHYLYDLVYNPLETLFLKKGQEKGAKTHNGLPMLHLQAEKAWEIWNQ